MDSTDTLLTSAAASLSPDVLRIIASKYRRTFEIKPCPYPEAITVEPVFIKGFWNQPSRKVEYYVFNTNKNIQTYILELNLNPEKDSSCVLTIGNGMGNMEHPLNVFSLMSYINFRKLEIYYLKKEDCIMCHKIPNIHLSFLHKGLILLKRKGMPITGDTSVILYHINKRGDVLSSDLRKHPLRKILYEDPTLWNWNPEKKEKCNCVLM
jgi:hypothetical protein